MLNPPTPPGALSPRRLGLLAVLALGAAVSAPKAQASEGGASLYLLGSGGPGNAIMPPLKGVFLDNEAYYYNGNAGGDRQFLVGGNVVAGLDAEILADFPTILWVPTLDLWGGTLAIGGALPVGEVSVDVSAVLTGLRGNQFNVSRSDSEVIVGDPVAAAALGWKRGKLHVQASSQVNIPIGHYRDGQLANLAFHRWIADTSLGASWHDDDSGWDVSGKVGVTFNGKNEATDYNTGTESHIEGSVEKRFNPSWSAGVIGYYFYQLTGDSGAGDPLGSFKGRVGGIGGTAAYDFKIGKVPLTLRARAFNEFDARNRPEGYSVWLGLTMPLAVQMPTGAP